MELSSGVSIDHRNDDFLDAGCSVGLWVLALRLRDGCLEKNIQPTNEGVVQHMCAKLTLAVCTVNISRYVLFNIDMYL